MCVNEAGSIRLMEEKDVEQVEELEKQCFSVPWSENILKRRLTGRFTASIFITATHTQQEAAKAVMARDASFVMTSATTHRSSEEMRPTGAKTCEEVSAGSGS